MKLLEYMKRIVIVLALMAAVVNVSAGERQKEEFELNSFWGNWYIQFGMDMSLQNPYGHDFFGGVFPNGKTFGVNASVGKWFTPIVGARAHVNWENGISLFKNGHDNWLAPFYQPGKNMDRGGYVIFVGDIQFDIHNLFFGYKDDRKWNMQVYPRAGGAYNFGVSKGTPLIGIGIGNTYRLSDKWLLYFDVAYNMVSSGFVGVEKNTGMGSNSNGFFEIGIGAQMNLGKTTAFSKKKAHSEKPAISGLWSDWFVQFGLDMTLQNPYGKDFFGDVFPKGKTFGIDAALGKWFTPQMALRGKVNWENGIPLFRNHHLEWVGPADDPDSNMDKGGILTMCIDMPISLKNIFMDYTPDQTWNCYVYPRAGLGCNLAIGSSSPLVGVGAGGTYRINDKLSVYAETAYQMITSEFTGGVSTTGMSVTTGSNGFLDFNVGVQIDL